jgi:hypothetical protein
MFLTDALRRFKGVARQTFTAATKVFIRSFQAEIKHIPFHCVLPDVRPKGLKLVQTRSKSLCAFPNLLF